MKYTHIHKIYMYACMHTYVKYFQILEQVNSHINYSRQNVHYRVPSHTVPEMLKKHVPWHSDLQPRLCFRNSWRNSEAAHMRRLCLP